MNSFFRRLVGLFILVSIASLFLVCVAGPFMAMGDMSQTTDCGMAHDSSLCPMMLSGQVGFWQKIVVPTSSTWNVLGILMLLVAIAFGWNSVSFLKMNEFRFRPVYDRASPSLFDYLQQLFSHGILRPKIY